MGRIVAITNQKGGVGKTTTTVNLAASLGATKRSVLLVDLDPQGNATVGCGIDKTKLKGTVNDVLLGEASMNEVIVASPVNFDVLPADGTLTVAEVRLLKVSDREQQLRKILEPIRNFYDYILIDCPPSLNMLTVNALIAADGVIIPIQCEYFALEGLAALINTIEQLRSALNPALRIDGLLRTMYDGRNRLTREVSSQLISHFGAQVFQTLIPRNVRLAEAPSHGLPVLYYDSRSQGATAYLALAGEIVRRQAAMNEMTVAAESEKDRDAHFDVSASEIRHCEERRDMAIS